MNKKIDLHWNPKQNKLYWLIGLVVLCSISGVFAHWTQELTAHNEFRTARYQTVLDEEFTSPDNWLPGEQINKDVWVTNKGSVPVFAKMTINQSWVRQSDITDLEGNVIAPKRGEAFPLVFSTGDSQEYAAQISWGDQVVLWASGKSSGIQLNLPTVEKIEDASGKWLLVNELPDQQGNYTLYYIGVIASGGKSPLAVDAVTMNEKIQPAILKKLTYYEKDTKKWVTTTEKNSSYDYECAKYTMLVSADTVQATANAVKEVFGTETDSDEVVSYLASHALKPSEL